MWEALAKNLPNLWPQVQSLFFDSLTWPVGIALAWLATNARMLLLSLTGLLLLLLAISILPTFLPADSPYSGNVDFAAESTVQWLAHFVGIVVWSCVGFAVVAFARLKWAEMNAEGKI